MHYKPVVTGIRSQLIELSALYARGELSKSLHPFHHNALIEFLWTGSKRSQVKFYWNVIMQKMMHKLGKIFCWETGHGGNGLLGCDRC